MRARDPFDELLISNARSGRSRESCLTGRGLRWLMTASELVPNRGEDRVSRCCARSKKPDLSSAGYLRIRCRRCLMFCEEERESRLMDSDVVCVAVA
jgi:hypothetical protein